MDIARDGEVIGSWTPEEVQDYLRSGNLAGSDYYLEGQEWLPLSNLIPRSAPPPPPPSPAPIPPATPPQNVVFQQQQQRIVSGYNEEEIWSGTPSQLANLPICFFFIFLLFIGPIVIGLLKPIPDYGTPFANNFGLCAFWMIMITLISIPVIILQYLKVRATRYVITTQRVKIMKGILSKDVTEVELYRVKDTAAHQSLFLRLFGLGNIKIISGDAKSPVLFIMAIPKAVDIREKLRHEILLMRQKMNVREAELM